MQKFDEILARVMRYPRTDIRDDLKLSEIPAWDSMNAIIFFSEVEKQYKIRFKLNEITQAQSIGDIKNILRRHPSK